MGLTRARRSNGATAEASPLHKLDGTLFFIIHRAPVSIHSGKIDRIALPCAPERAKQLGVESRGGLEEAACCTFSQCPNLHVAPAAPLGLPTGYVSFCHLHVMPVACLSVPLLAPPPALSPRALSNTTLTVTAAGRL